MIFSEFKASPFTLKKGNEKNYFQPSAERREFLYFISTVLEYKMLVKLYLALMAHLPFIIKLVKLFQLEIF